MTAMPIRFACRSIFCGLLLSLSLLAGSSLLVADESKPSAQAAPVSYWTDVRPIFQAHCQGCHQPAKPSGEYVMTSFDALLRGGESESPAIVAGDPDGSYLVEQITPVDGKAAMPQEAEPLADFQIALIRQWIAQGAKDDTPASAREVFDADHPPTYQGIPVLTALAFSPDGKLIATSGYHEVLLHDIEKIRATQPSLVGRLVGMSERVESIAFDPSGERLAVVGGSPGRMGELQVWSVPKRELTLSVPITYDTCYGASWSPDGKLVAVGCPDNSVRAFQADDGKQVLFNGAHNDWVLDTVFSLDGKHIVSVSRDRSMKLIEVATERFVDNITSITPGALKGGLHAVDRHPTKNELLIGGADGVPKIYRMFREQSRKIGDDFNLIRKFPGIPGRIFDVAFSADGQRIAAGSSFNGQGHVHVYDTDAGSLVAEMQDIPSAIYAVAFHPGGDLIASAGFSGFIYLHDPQTGSLKFQFLPVPPEALQIVEADR